METFAYTVSDAGIRKTGIIEAKDISEAGDLLRDRSLIVLNLKSITGAKQGSADSFTGFDSGALAGRLLISKRQVEVMLDQLATMIDSGILAVNAMEGLCRQNPWMLRRALKRSAMRIRGGETFGATAAKEMPWIGNVGLGLINAGESNGRLPDMLRYGSGWLKRSRQIRNRLIEALTYPAVVTMLAGAVGYFLVTYIIPRIIEFITKHSANAVLPPSTQLLVDITHGIQNYGIYVLLGLVLAVFAFIMARRTESLGKIVDLCLLHVPVIGPVLVASANAVWCHTFGILLSSGIFVVQALEMVSETTPNKHYKAETGKIREDILRGTSISDALLETSLPRYCPMASMMLEVGEGTGTADTSLMKAAEYYEENLLQRISVLSRLIEPAIYLVVGAMVGFVYYAFFMAIQAVSMSMIR